MPAVKRIHQVSDSNTKPEFIFGHSCQTVAVLLLAASSVFAVPLACQIHEGLRFSNRDHRTLFDKMMLLLSSLPLDQPFLFVADAYYATAKIVLGLLAGGNHLVTRVKSNAVAYALPPSPDPRLPPKRGRPKRYGHKIMISSLLQQKDLFLPAISPIYGESNITLRYRVADLLWRPVGLLVHFVLVHNPSRGPIIPMSTDLSLSPLEIIQLYGLHFKTEFSFKQALRVVGTFAYHFWMVTMTPFPKNRWKSASA